MRVPIATYRLQISDAFTLHDARALVPYLAHLGISDLYLSPIFGARPGSSHGYDVTDHAHVRESVGGLGALRALAAETHRHQMGILLDIVPNHMAASSHNPWWRDVLTHGSTSRYAKYFDIDWGTTADQPRRLRLPVLGADADVLIDRGEIRIVAEPGEVIYHEARFPLRPDGPRSGSPHEILAAQHYELVHWRTASSGMSYRRFFDIADLAGVRVEDDDVFDDVHRFVRELAADGTITGLRIDHIDGLRDPAGYLARLRTRVRGPDGGPVYTVVEKILGSAETLPADWQCEGTTGYEFLSLASAFLMDPAGASQIGTLYRRITGDSRSFAELAREKKLLVMERLFGGELAALARQLAALTGLGHAAARRAVAEVTASMEVYRTYRVGRDVGAADRRRILEATADAQQRTLEPELRAAIVALRSVLLCDTGADSEAALDWVMRWQQFTGPVMAKGFEDTALYCHNALLAANDVGCDPAQPCLDEAALYHALQRRTESAALSLNATATHDTKRGEDTRARIAVLSQIPGEWRDRLRRWIRQGDEWKNEVAEEDESVAPSGDVESLLYQTLLGAWPTGGIDDEFRARIQEYMTKAVREAKEQTSWRQPDQDYEQALTSFIEYLMAEFGREGLAEDIGRFALRLAPHGVVNALAQLLLKITAPGIPDIYQGTELWSHTLVDPDNRRPVDFAERRRLFDHVIGLRDTPAGDALRDLLESWPDGRIKLVMTALALRFRAMHRFVFEAGDVTPLPAEGERAANVFAFARSHRRRSCIIVLPRSTAALSNDPVIPAAAWAGTVLHVPPQLRQRWHNALTGETHPAGGVLPVDALFRSIPFALLDASQPIGA